jgi:hypothetical protein
MFQVGQKVVCINNGPSRFGWQSRPKILRKGAIYTVTACWIHDVNHVPAVTLAEVKPTFGYNGFDAARFAPVDKRDTDITIFKKMLTPSKQDA